MRKTIVLVVSTLTILSWYGCQSGEQPGLDANGSDRVLEWQHDVEVQIDSLDALRSSLAPAAGVGNVDETTFAVVCKPVGVRAAEISKQNGWMVRQVARKNRNPANDISEKMESVFTDFENDSNLKDAWIQGNHLSTEATGWMYYRRITVENACLACHGEQETRPKFVVEKYPEDQAFDFSVGDLRGLYAVFVPDSLSNL